MHMRPTGSRRPDRTGFYAEIDPELVNAVKQAAADRGVRNWWVVEEALRRGLPLVPPAAEEVLPYSA